MSLHTEHLIKNPHPGETLKEGLADLGITQYRLAIDLGIPHSRVTAIVKGRQGITATTALKLGKYLGTGAEYWLNLQKFYELEEAKASTGDILEKIKPAPELELV